MYIGGYTKSGPSELLYGLCMYMFTVRIREYSLCINMADKLTDKQVMYFISDEQSAVTWFKKYVVLTLINRSDLRFIKKMKHTAKLPS